MKRAIDAAAAGTFVVRSRSRGGVDYEMQHTPDGFAVHQGEGCEGEAFNGPVACWHSKDYSVSREELEDMTQAVTRYESGAIVEARAFNDEDVATLKNTICKGASDSEVKLFIATCKHTGLDPFMRQIHCVMRSVKVGEKWEKQMTIQVGIDGYRKIADDTGKMQGLDGPQWTYDGKTWEDLPREQAEPPLAARCAVWRAGVERPFIAVCRWSAYVQKTSTGAPNSVWASRGPEQLAKCAEALALRRAFPAQMAALPQRPDYIDDEEVEMERQSWVEAKEVIDAQILPDGFGEPDGAKKPAQVEHERSILKATQQAPVSASDGSAAASGGLGGDPSIGLTPATPAAPSPDDEALAATATDEQLATISDYSAAIKDGADGKAKLLHVDAQRRLVWPYAIDEGRRFHADRLTEADANAYIALLKGTHEGTAQPALVT